MTGEKQKKEPTKRSSALSSQVHTSKVRKTSFRLWPHAFERWPPSDLLNYTQNKEAHKQNEGKPSFRRRQKMFKTVLSLQARPIIEGRNLGIRTPLRVVATCRSTSAGLSKLGATPTAQTGTKTHRENCDNEEGKSGKNNIHTFQSRIFNTLPRSIRLPAASRPACLLVPGSCGPWSWLTAVLPSNLL